MASIIPAQDEEDLSPPQLGSKPQSNEDEEDEDGDDTAPDFRIIRNKIPARGEKDFQPHGTHLQRSQLQAKRDAMYQVLALERVGRGVPRAMWDVALCGAWCEVSGKFAVSVGRDMAVPGRFKDVVAGGGVKKLPLQRLFLLPEETLWLVDRGSLDVRWPNDKEEEFEGLPLSLQALRAVALGDGLTLEQYQVYQYFKRAGYNVLRADINWQNVPKTSPTPPAGNAQSYWDMWTRLWTFIIYNKPVADAKHRPGPIILPGLYRDYRSIYAQLGQTPFHDAYTPRTPTQSTKDNPRVHYHIYKPDSHFRKSNPGPPSEYVAVINARTSSFPSQQEIAALLDQTPDAPLAASSKIQNRVRKGGRSVVLAVVDTGITSFLRFSDAGLSSINLAQRVFSPRSRIKNTQQKGGKKT